MFQNNVKFVEWWILRVESCEMLSHVILFKLDYNSLSRSNLVALPYLLKANQRLHVGGT